MAPFFLTSMRNSFCFFAIILFLTSCVGKRSDSNVQSVYPEPDSSMILNYATGFSVDYFSKYKRVILYNPWQKGVELTRYYLASDSFAGIPSDGPFVKIPLTSLASGSCTHNTFLQQLGVLRLVTGICDANRTFNPYLRAHLANGDITDLGDPFKINLERCMLLKPQVLMINSYNQQDENLERIKDSGIPVLYNNEWMETDLLGRAEWIRFIACFFNKEAQADSIFRRVEANYLALKVLASNKRLVKPTVLSGDDFRGSWYMPGGRSYTAQLFADAGAEYAYKNDTSLGSFSLTFEQVLNGFNQADVWVGVTNATTLSGLRKLDERYSLFKAFKTGNLWAYNLRTTPTGGNDFWETGVARPDLLLSDYIKVFHPHLLSKEPWHFLKKIQ